MKKIMFYIWALGLTLLLSISPSGEQNVHAQDTGAVAVGVTVEGYVPCIWDGAEGTSNLTVEWNEVCEINGTVGPATSVTVDSGGTLLVGNISVTAFTINGLIDAQGDIVVGGVNGDSWNSNLITTSNNLQISNGGTVTTQSNINGYNYLTVDGVIYVGTSGAPSGTLTLNDATTTSYENTAKDINIYDNDGGIALAVGSGVVLIANDTGGTASTIMYNTSAFTNNGTFTTEEFRIGTTGTDNPTYTNYGITHTTDTGTYSLYVMSGTVSNPAIMTIDGSLNVAGASGNEGNYTQTAGTTDVGGSSYNANIISFGRIDIDGGTFDANGMNITGSGSDEGILDIGVSGTVSVTNNINLGTTGGTDESGSITNYGNITYGSSTYLHIYDDSTFTNYAGAAAYPNELYVYSDGVVTNQATATLGNSALSFYLYGDGTLDQSGILIADGLDIATNSTYPGTVSGATMTSYNGSTSTILTYVYVGDPATTGGTWNVNSGGAVTISSGDVDVLDSDASITVNGDFDISNKLEISGGGDVTVNTSDTLTIGTIKIDSTSSGVSSLNLNAGTININKTQTYCASAGGLVGDSCSIEIGNVSGAGSSELNITGTLNVVDAIYPDNEIHINSAGNGKLTIADGGLLNVDETSGSFNVTSATPYGFYVEGTADLEMPLNNTGGYIKVDNTAIGTATLTAKNYTQASSLYVANGDSMTVEGSADLTGTSDIYGTLTVNDCTHVSASASDTLTIRNTGVFITGDGSCSLSGTESTDGFNVEGGEFISENGSSTTVTGDLTFDSSDSQNIYGVFSVSEILRVKDASVIYLQNTATPYTAKSFLINHPSAEITNNTSIRVQPSVNLNLSGSHTCNTTDECAVEVTGYGDPTHFGNLYIYGNLTVLSSSSGDFRNDQAYVYVDSSGTINYNNASAGTFKSLNGAGKGDVYLAGDLNTTRPVYFTGALNIPATGTLDSTYTGVENAYETGESAYLGLYGQILLDDSAYIGTTGNYSIIDGYFEAAEAFTYASTSTSASWLMDAGEIKVTGTGDLITINNDLYVYGKINGADGNADVEIGSGAILDIHQGQPDTSYFYINARDFTLDGNIDVSGIQSCTNPSGTQTYGGSFGGQGGNAATPNSTFGLAKHETAPSYSGTPNPVGMCGFLSSGDTVATYSGGAVYVEATGDIAINGYIRADGNDTTVDNSGAGSGGLIVIKHTPTLATATFTGAGYISADGGGGATGTGRYPGGGGRIIIDSPLYDDPDSTSYNYSGSVHADGGVIGSTYAAAGTMVYLGDGYDVGGGGEIQKNGTLIVDQGGNASTVLTEIPEPTAEGGSAADWTFDRVEERNSAAISFESTGPTPTACYGTIPNLTCNAYPDKPDTLYINNSAESAQSDDEPGYIAGNSSGVSDTPLAVSDLTPVFSVVYRHPTSSAAATKVQIQIDDNSSFASPIWDYTKDGIKQQDGVSDVIPGDRIGDITYDEDATATGPLSLSTPYYMRVRFTDGSNHGLWNHADFNEQYKFQIDDYLLITANCLNSEFSIEDANNPGNSIKSSSGTRFGGGSCELGLNSTDSAWQVFFGMASAETDFDDGGGNSLASINNSTDCDMVEAGTETLEKYGFNISNITDGTATTNSDCSVAYDTAQKYFNVEPYVTRDTVITSASATTGVETFDLNMYVNAGNLTVPSSYSLSLSLLITTNP